MRIEIAAVVANLSAYPREHGKRLVFGCLFDLCHHQTGVMALKLIYLPHMVTVRNLPSLARCKIRCGDPVVLLPRVDLA